MVSSVPVRCLACFRRSSRRSMPSIDLAARAVKPISAGLLQFFAETSMAAKGEVWTLEHLLGADPQPM